MAITTGSLLFAMLKEDCMTDVTFIVEGSEIRAHGVVAACRGGELKRVLQGEKKRAEINGITPQTFNTVLEYLYTAEVKVTESNVFLLLHAALELGLTCLQLECAKYLKNKLTTENFYAYATEAVNCGLQEFIKSIQGYFGQNTSVLLRQKSGVFGCRQEVLRVLCASEEINCSEVELFLCCMEWAKHKCQEKNMQENPENLRHILGDTLDNIRFSTMDLGDFRKTVVSMQILTFEETGRIMYAQGTEKVRGPEHEGATVLFADADRKETETVQVSNSPGLVAETEENIETIVASNECMHKQGKLSIEGKYDQEEARKCLVWIKQVVPEIEEISSDPDASHDAFWNSLKDGMVLCKLIDKLMPGKINWNDKTFQTPKIEAMKVMRERERIAMFTKRSQEFGVPEMYSFPTESLTDKVALNLAQVCVCLRAIGIEAQNKGIGPADYWPKKSQGNKREWTEEQLRAGQNTIGLQMGSNKGASQAGMNIGKSRHILD